MKGAFTRLVIVSTMVFVFLIPFSPGVIWADGCVVSKIAIVAGPWEQMDTKISYTVQAQDSASAACQVTETLRLAFASSGSGTFTGQTGKPVQEFISKSDANRNFYYRHTTGTADTITIKAGYGPADSWSVKWETSLKAPDSVSVQKTDTPPDSATTTKDAAPAPAKDQKSTTASTTGSATTTQIPTVSATSTSSTTTARSEVAVALVENAVKQTAQEQSREPSQGQSKAQIQTQNQTQKNEQPISPPKKADMKKTTPASATPSASKSKIQPEDSASTTSSLETSGGVSTTTPEQLAIAAIPEQMGTTAMGWAAPLGFVGVLLMGIVALYVHKIM